MEEILKKVVTVIVLLAVLFLKKHHVKRMRESKRLSIGVIVKDFAISIYVIIAAIIMIAVVENIGIFVGIYIALPILISGLYVLYIGDEKIYAIYYITKGIFYFGLAVFTLYQLLLPTESNISNYAVGATVSLAIIEGFTASVDGIKRLIVRYDKKSESLKSG